MIRFQVRSDDDDKAPSVLAQELLNRVWQDNEPEILAAISEILAGADEEEVYVRLGKKIGLDLPEES